MRAVVVSRTYINPAYRGKLRALAGMGAAVAVAVPERWRLPITGETLTAVWGDDAGVRVVPVGVRALGARPASAAWDRSTLRKLLRDFRPDIIQVEEDPWSQVAATVTRLASRMQVPSVLYSADSVTRSHPFGERWRRARTVKRAAGFIGENKVAAGILARGFPDIPATVIPQLGVSVPRQVAERNHQRFVIGFVGRLVPEKGLDILLRASVRLQGNWDLVVVGSGPAQEELEKLAERLGIAARVTWMGALPPEDLAGAWPGFDCVVLPARTTRDWVEAHGRAVITAMGHGLPVVGSTSGAIPEIIGPAGFVVSEDNVSDLAVALQELLSHPERRTAFAAEGRRRVMSEYVDAAVARRTLDFWRTIIDRRAAGRAG